MPFRDLMAERLGLPVEVDNDANVAAIAEWRAGAARGADHAVVLTIGTGIGGGLILGGAPYRGSIGAGAELGHVTIDVDGPPCQGHCPNNGCLETMASGTALAREGRRIAGERPDSALGRALADGREVTGALITELAHDGDEAALDGARADRHEPRRRDRVLPERLQSGRRRDRRRRDRGGRAAARAGARGGGAARAADDVPARADRAGAVRHRGGARGSGGARVRRPAGRGALMPGRLIVCPTPIGNLEDVTLRVLSALREADLIACEDTRRTRTLLDRYGVSSELLSYHEHNERERAAELVRRMQAGANVALVSDAGMPLVSDPGFLLVQACVAAGLAVEVLPGPSAALAALVASALPAERWRFAGFLPRKRGELKEAFGTPETLVAFESPNRVAASLAVLAQLDPARPVAVCRELTKLHEEVVRGTAAELAERYASEPPRGEVVLVVGAAPEAEAPLEPALDALRRLVDAGAKPRPAAGVVSELTGVPANALYKALTDASVT